MGPRHAILNNTGKKESKKAAITENPAEKCSMHTEESRGRRPAPGRVCLHQSASEQIQRCYTLMNLYTDDNDHINLMPRPPPLVRAWHRRMSRDRARISWIGVPREKVNTHCLCRLCPATRATLPSWSSFPAGGQGRVLATRQSEQYIAIQS